MRLLLLLFLLSINSFADSFTQELISHCEKRPVGLFIQFSRFDQHAIRGDVEGSINFLELQTRGRDEFDCNAQALALIEKRGRELVTQGWESAVDQLQYQIESKVSNFPKLTTYETVRELKDELNNFCIKLGKKESDYINVNATVDYIQQGGTEDIKLLIQEIKEQAKYRDPSVLIANLERLVARENYTGRTFSRARKERLIVNGIKAQAARKLSCANINNLRSPLGYNNARSQDEIGWCFAFAGADLVSHQLGVMISPIDMALNHNNIYAPDRIGNPDARETTLEGGFPELAIMATRAKGFCPESVLPEKGAFAKQHHDYVGILERLEDYYDSYHDNDTVDGCMDSELKFNCQAIFPGLPLQGLLEIVANSSPTEFLDKIVEENCKDHRIHLSSDIRIKSFLYGLPFLKSHLWNKLDKQLDKGNIATMVYAEEVLHNHRDFTDPGLSGNHVSVVAGRRFNEANNSCEYLIRNSHGDWCAGYDQSYECQTGHVWVSEQYLNRSLQTISYLE